MMTWITGAGLFGFAFFLAALFRRVVGANEVHIVQYAKKTVSYGKDTASGNSYYEWPSWVPLFGVTKAVLPVSVFDLDLKSYEAYDEGRLPFHVDVKAFFRVADSNTAAQRVASFQELESQLVAIVQGAVRTILASHKLEEIMQGRSKFGEAFTAEVKGQLPNWGVEAVKSIELMDIRDTDNSQVIHNIMAKKKSYIEMESRTEVAKNNQAAEIAEIAAKREIELQAQVAKQAVGTRTAEANKQVQVAEQEALQAIRVAEKTSKDKEMDILRVSQARAAEIAKEAALIAADQAKQQAVLQAEGQLKATQLAAEGIEATGAARAEAEKALQLAPVTAQITLAKEIGANEAYQQYLTTLRRIEASQAVGIEQAKALEKAEVKVIVNAGTPPEGVKTVMDLFSAKGGTELASALEAAGQIPAGQALLKKLGFGNGEAAKK